MATLATISNRYFDAAAESTDTALARADNAFRLRPLANEDVYFFSKEIDNTRVVRQADPQAAGICWRFIIAGTLSVILLTGMLLPSAYALLAGYQIQSLKAERQKLLEEQSSLDLRVAGLLSPDRLQKLATEESLREATPDHVVYLNPKADGSVAMDFTNHAR